MKVRHKILKEKVHPDVIQQGAFYIQRAGTGGVHIAFSADDYEPVPVEPTWRDVTAECAVVDDGLFLRMPATIGSMNGTVTSRQMPDGYRLRKLQFYNGPHAPFWAFIVEKKEP